MVGTSIRRKHRRADLEPPSLGEPPVDTYGFVYGGIPSDRRQPGPSTVRTPPSKPRWSYRRPGVVSSPTVRLSDARLESLLLLISFEYLETVGEISKNLVGGVTNDRAMSVLGRE